MSTINNENNQDARPRTLKSTASFNKQILKRSALNNVTNTTLSQEHNSSNTNTSAFGKALRSAKSRLATARAAGSLIPQVKRDGAIDETITAKDSELDKENVDPFASKLPSIEEEERDINQQLKQQSVTSSAGTLSSGEVDHPEQQSMLNDDDEEEEEQTTTAESQPQGQELTNAVPASCHGEIKDVSKKRPISTVVEHEEPKKFKVCEKGTEYEWEDLDAEDVNDPFMVSEYVNDIFEYLHRLEIMTLPNRHELYKHSNIRQNRDILVNWMVKIHNKFGLLPETLYLALNIMDRFLCKELVQLEKLQLVGTACLFIAAKYEEVYSPSVKHFAYETDGACDEEEIKEGEKFILQTLEFNLSYPNPMNFLRRISKADDYDIQSRTLAKYLLEISVVDFRFIGILPSLCAAAAMFLSRKMLGKGQWDGNLIHYSGGYTREELAPVCNMIMDYLVQPVVHDEFFRKYASRRFMKASVISRQWAKKVVAHGYDIMTLHESSSE